MTDAAAADTLPEPLAMYDLALVTDERLQTVRRCARALADAGVNIDAVNYTGVNGSRLVHLLVQDGPDAARILTRDQVDEVTCRPVLVYTLPNRPGTLARYAGALVDGGVAVDFIYQATAKGVVVAAPDLEAVRACFAAAPGG
jgi:hypothetical protein